VLQRQFQQALTGLLFVIVAIGLGFLSRIDSSASSFVWVLLGIPMGIFALVLIVGAFNQNEMGAKKAIQLKQPEFDRQGYDAFWTPKEYSALRQERA
jgi:hypothetical protein